MDCECSDVIDNVIDDEVIGDGRVFKREVGFFIIVRRGSGEVVFD